MPPDATPLLRARAEGDESALQQLMPVVYDELKRRAAACLRRERPGHMLEPTALVHEVYLRLVHQHRIAWKNRDQFFGVAVRMMRRILVDQARASRRLKRSARWVQVTLDEAIGGSTAVRAATIGKDIDVLALDEALARLAAFDARKSRVAELRFFSGLSLHETARVVGISVATVEREWQAARAWLHASLR